MRVTNMMVAVAVMATAGSAFGADLIVKTSPSQPAPISAGSWAGFYAGLHAGWSTSANVGADLSGDNLANGTQFAIDNGHIPGHIDLSFSGFIGGAQAGYNWQRGQWVWGFETDLSYAHINGSKTVPPLIPALSALNYLSTTQSIDWFGTVRGRAGMLVTPTALFYATGGLAYGHVDTHAFAQSRTVGMFDGDTATTRIGWTLGAGAEYAVASQWTAKAEYLYFDLGRVSTFSPAQIGGYYAMTDTTYKGHIFRAGVNRRFD